MRVRQLVRSALVALVVDRGWCLMTRPRPGCVRFSTRSDRVNAHGPPRAPSAWPGPAALAAAANGSVEIRPLNTRIAGQVKTPERTSPCSPLTPLFSSLLHFSTSTSLSSSSQSTLWQCPLLVPLSSHPTRSSPAPTVRLRIPPRRRPFHHTQQHTTNMTRLSIVLLVSAATLAFANKHSNVARE